MPGPCTDRLHRLCECVEGEAIPSDRVGEHDAGPGRMRCCWRCHENRRRSDFLPPLAHRRHPPRRLRVSQLAAHVRAGDCPGAASAVTCESKRRLCSSKRFPCTSLKMSTPIAREYVSYANLMILGDDLDPADVSKTLRLRPSKSWKRTRFRCQAENRSISRLSTRGRLEEEPPGFASGSPVAESAPLLGENAARPFQSHRQVDRRRSSLHFELLHRHPGDCFGHPAARPPAWIGATWPGDSTFGHCRVTCRKTTRASCLLDCRLHKLKPKPPTH